MVKVGSVELGPIPRIAVPLTDLDLQQDLAAAKRYADIFEIRIDAFQQHDPEYVTRVCTEARAHGVPLLATVRAANEGGRSKLTEPQRLALFRAVMGAVDAVDIEFHSIIRHDVKAAARLQHKPVVVSYHNFEKTSPDKDLLAIINTAKRDSADIVKLALTAQNQADVDRMVGTLREHRAKNIILIALGPHGMMSRVFFPLIGSLLTYGYLHEANAPGQMSIEELNTELTRYSPEFGKHRATHTAS